MTLPKPKDDRGETIPGKLGDLVPKETVEPELSPKERGRLARARETCGESGFASDAEGRLRTTNHR